MDRTLCFRSDGPAYPVNKESVAMVVMDEADVGDCNITGRTQSPPGF